jgi:hypothetical protein
MSVVKIEAAHCALDKARMKNPLVEKCSYSRDGGRSENLGVSRNVEGIIYPSWLR